MTKKIVFWLDADLTSFCLAYFLQQKLDVKLYAIVDITNKPKEFFLNQKLIHFEQIWFYHDYVLQSSDEICDINELYTELNIPELIENDRILNSEYNEFYNFTEIEKNSIASNELNLFNEVLKIGPEIFVTSETNLRPHHTFHQFCQLKNIRILMLNNANWGELSYISENYHRLDNFNYLFQNRKNETSSFEKLEKRLEEKILSKNLKSFYKKNRNSIFKKFSAAINYFILSNNKNIKTHYTYFGRTKTKVLYYEIKSRLEFRKRQNYINKNFLSKIPNKKKIIFFAMQQEPERSLLISAPQHTDQTKTIEFLAESIPDDYLLVVKEHPTQGPGRGWRKISEYEKLKNIHNVFMIHPTVSSTEIIKKSELVISVNGTVSLEASILNTPSITFVNDNFSLISSIQKLNPNTNLEQLIKNTLKIKVNPNEVSKYFDILEENCFIFNQINFQLHYLTFFYLGGNLVDVKIDENAMKKFLDLEEKNFDIPINELIKKIES